MRRIECFVVRCFDEHGIMNLIEKVPLQTVAFDVLLDARHRDVRALADSALESP